MNTHTVTRIGILVGAALVLGYVERLIPLPFALPGIKLGLANTVLLYGLYMMTWRNTMTLMVLKVLLSGILFAGFSGALYSFSGGLLSLVIMLLMMQYNDVSIVGVSISGAVAHNIGQVLMAMLVVQTRGLLLYLPVLMVSGVITGMLTGVIAKNVLKGLSFHRPSNEVGILQK